MWKHRIYRPYLSSHEPDTFLKAKYVLVEEGRHFVRLGNPHGDVRCEYMEQFPFTRGA